MCWLTSNPMVSMARYEWTNRKVDMLQSTLAISITAMADSISVIPGHPYPLMPPPARLSFAKLGTRAKGNSAFSL